MILSDREIRASIDRGAIKILPEPEGDRWSSTAIDLTLDSKIQVWRGRGEQGASLVIDPAAVDFNVASLADQHAEVVSCSEGYDLKPGVFVLGWTVETIQLPHTSRIAARVEGKSSLARLGVGVHVTAPTIHAGFGYRQVDPNFLGAPIQLEIWNAGPLTVRLTRGLAICQLILEEVHGTPDKGYHGQFSFQGPGEAGP